MTGARFPVRNSGKGCVASRISKAINAAGFRQPADPSELGWFIIERQEYKDSTHTGQRRAVRAGGGRTMRTGRNSADSLEYAVQLIQAGVVDNQFSTALAPLLDGHGGAQPAGEVVL